MKSVIITIGDEILLGQILDTNSRFIARELAALGRVQTRRRRDCNGRPRPHQRRFDEKRAG